MPFQKGNQLAKKGHGEHSKRSQWNNIVGWLVGNGGEKYKKLLINQSEGVEINKEQKEFMDRYYSLLEFHQPKLARSESKIKGDVKHDHSVQIEFVNENTNSQQV